MYVEFVIFFSRLYFTLFFSHIKVNFFFQKSQITTTKLKISSFINSYAQNIMKLFLGLRKNCRQLRLTLIQDVWFKTMLKIWDYTNVSFKEYQKLSFDDRSTIPRNYYSEISIYIEVEIYFLYFWLGFFMRQVSWFLF